MHLPDTNRGATMLRITTEKKRGKTILSVEGRLAGPWVAALEQCWRERTASPSEKFHVDLCGVSFIDAAGKVLLNEIHRQGGRLIAEGCLNQAIVQEIEAGEGGQNGLRWPAKRLTHYFLRCCFSVCWWTPAFADAQGTGKQNALAGDCADWGLAIDAGSGRGPGAEAEHDGADCGFDGGAERSRTRTWRGQLCCRRRV